jgi:hypothetical protein
MKIKEHIQYWVESAEHDLDSAESLFAAGKYDWSDIDLALVSDAFEGERFRDRNKIRRIKLEISCDFEPLPYRPEDFTTDDPFVQKIIETGMRIV